MKSESDAGLKRHRKWHKNQRLTPTARRLTFVCRSESAR